MKLAITGGHGFFGFNFINYLINQNIECEIINIDSKKKINLQKNIGNCKSVFADITNYEKTRSILRNVEYVIHFAGVSTIANDSIEPIDYTKINVLGTHNLVEAARINRIKKFVLISSCEVCKNEIGDFHFPQNIYAASKIGAEAVLIAYYNMYHFPAMIIRPTNLFGPFQVPNRIISSFIVKMLTGHKIVVMGNGKCKRDYLYIEDACAAVYKVLEKGEIGNIYNLASGRLISNLKIAYSILHYFNKDDSWMEIVQDRNVENHIHIPKDNKIRGLGWRKKYSFNAALKKTIAWYKENSSLYE